MTLHPARYPTTALPPKHKLRTGSCKYSVVYLFTNISEQEQEEREHGREEKEKWKMDEQCIGKKVLWTVVIDPGDLLSRYTSSGGYVACFSVGN